MGIEVRIEEGRKGRERASNGRIVRNFFENRILYVVSIFPSPPLPRYTPLSFSSLSFSSFARDARSIDLAFPTPKDSLKRTAQNLAGSAIEEYSFEREEEGEKPSTWKSC